ncbi:hypothetical protein OIDMADRAFT_134826 [Oidiodendron maius Zn]|uniref:PLD phosphodiesterase domain-containing protein n=1 Tax=Oidiodendron maius (strain Zn) TaxID=913774 RepID=A0A0C3GUH4_OIDMZ|nr:hypothetical protein OIDMADRAFT_134826 [Oidiodendron maius Zn]
MAQHASTLETDASKRKASSSPPHPSGLSTRIVKPKLSELAPSPTSAASKTLPIHLFKDQERALQYLGVQFPDGVVKKTWVYDCHRQDDIKIEEVLQKDDLELAVLSSFQIDPDWVASKLHPTTKVVFVLQARTEIEKENIRSGAPGNYRFCFPAMEGNVNCMHSKLQLLSHPTHLRVVVPSANLVSYDWGETGTMENVCFLIDLPRLPEGEMEGGGLTEFGKELFHFAQAMGLDEKLINSLRRFDFSRTSHLAFVHSIGGSHSGREMERTGYCGLGRAVRNLALHTEETLDIDVVAASIGNLNESFIKSLYLAAQGDNGMKEYGWRTSRPAKGKGETPAEHKLSDILKDCFRIYFPTRETVANSKGGLSGAGTICFQSKWYDLDTFPKHLMRECQSRRRAVLMHNKMIFVQPRDVGREGGKPWVYVGSANLSESAWGRLVKDKSTKELKLNCRNWECGVIVSGLAATSGRAFTKQSGIYQQALAGVELFGEHVPVPMVVPGEEYGTRRPWFYNEA